MSTKEMTIGEEIKEIIDQLIEEYELDISDETEFGYVYEDIKDNFTILFSQIFYPPEIQKSIYPFFMVVENKNIYYPFMGYNFDKSYDEIKKCYYDDYKDKIQEMKQKIEKIKVPSKENIKDIFKINNKSLMFYYHYLYLLNDGYNCENNDIIKKLLSYQLNYIKYMIVLLTEYSDNKAIEDEILTILNFIILIL